MTIISNHGIPIKVDSDKLTLHKIFVSGNNTALILKKDGATLSLIQDSAIETGAKYSVIGKNLIIESQFTKEGAAGYLSVIGDFGYVNSITGKDCVDITAGEFIKISEDEFDKYIQGVYTVTFDVNGGNALTETEKTVYFGSTYGELPMPTRENCTFEGWFTEDGTQITNDTPFTEPKDIILKAHWTSEWVLADALPEDASVESEKWTYILREYTEQSTDSYSGWTKYDTKRTSWGATQGPVYSNPSNGSRNVWSEKYVASTTTHYTFYHRYGWGYNTSTGANGYVWGSDSQLGSGARHEIDLTYDLSQGTNLAGNARWKGYTCPHCGEANIWFGRSTYVVENKADRWYYQEPVYTYYYYRDLSKEASTDPTEQQNVSNIQKWVQYTVK